MKREGKETKKETPESPISLRVPPEMRARLQQIADDDMRSLSNLILLVLKKYLDGLDADAGKKSK
jgi:hypothetical protein